MTRNLLAIFWLPLCLIVGSAAFIGWVFNIIAIAHVSAFSGLLILRVVGVFIPIIGAVLGYF